MPERRDERLEGVRLLVFDADGTLRRTTVPGKPCPHGPDEWELLPGVRERLTPIFAGDEAPLAAVASNQDHVGYGLLSETDARELLRSALRAATGRSPADDVIELCPHPVDAACGCRKPSPGMLRRLMRRHGVRPHETLFVGNAETDRGAAEAAGARFVWAHEFFGWG